ADQVVFEVTDSKLIPAKAGEGDSDLQARNIRFDNYTFLKEKEEQKQKMWVRLWDDGRGNRIVLFPNLTCSDQAWRGVFRDVRCRRALSLAIDRDEINQAIYFGLGAPANNTVLNYSPLYKPDYSTTWATFDIDQANQLLDEMGLTKRNDDSIRLLPDGKPMVIIIDTSGESTEETDVLQLTPHPRNNIPLDLFPKPPA